MNAIAIPCALLLIFSVAVLSLSTTDPVDAKLGKGRWSQINVDTEKSKKLLNLLWGKVQLAADVDAGCLQKVSQIVKSEIEYLEGDRSIRRLRFRICSSNVCHSSYADDIRECRYCLVEVTRVKQKDKLDISSFHCSKRLGDLENEGSQKPHGRIQDIDVHGESSIKLMKKVLAKLHLVTDNVGGCTYKINRVFSGEQQNGTMESDEVVRTRFSFEICKDLCTHLVKPYECRRCESQIYQDDTYPIFRIEKYSCEK